MGGSYSLPATIGFQITGFRNFMESGFLRHSKHWNHGDLEINLSSQVHMITGANSGIGYAAAEEIARRKAKLYLVCRNKEKGEEAVSKLKEITNNQNIHLRVLDVSVPKAVKTFAQEFEESGERLDVLVNCAGVLTNERKLTEDGIESTFATNTLGTFLLTEYLLPVLKRSAPSRVIVVSSGGMYTQKMDVSDFQSSKGNWDGTRAYAQTKRQQLILSEIWAKKYADTGITFNAMHPGWARTPGTQSSLPSWFDKLPLRTPAQGADTIVWLAVAERAKDFNGKFWFDRELANTHISFAHTQSSEEDYQKLYDYCSQWLK